MVLTKDDLREIEEHFDSRYSGAIKEVVNMGVRMALEDYALELIVDKLAARVGGYQIRVLIEKVGK